MKNLADDIIPLLNFLRPINDPIVRNKVFEGNDYEMKLSEKGKNYLQQMATGYISFYRGGNPFTFAEKREIGEIPKELIFTPLIRCEMLPFQYKIYKEVTAQQTDALDKVSESISNFVFPTFDLKTKEIIGYYGEQGMEKLKIQINDMSTEIMSKLNAKFFNNKVDNKDIMYVSKNKIQGKIFAQPYLKHFSPKFDACLTNLNKVNGTIFVYSNLVQVGVKLFEEVLLENGYLEYNEQKNYIFNNNTRHYKYNISYSEFNKNSSFKSEEFIPATFISVTGNIEDSTDIPTEKLNTIRNIFNNITNQEGKYIKILIGSKVVNEGVTLENIKEIHILDVHYHLGRVDQIIGRGIRHCKHYKTISPENLNPTVSVYKYVVSVPGFKELSKEEELYRKAEYKYITIKKVERALIEVSVDCPINFSANQLVEDVIKYNNCKNIDSVMRDKNNKKYLCPARCEFDTCKFKCGQHSLNLQYYDKDRNIYKMINNSHLDYTTFSKKLARIEINFAKQTIKDLYRLEDYYTLEQFIDKIKNKYDKDKRDMFDEFFIYQALDELLPLSEEDLFNFEDNIYNKYNVMGYLIYRDNYYLFQPLGEKNNITMDFRSSFHEPLIHNLKLGDYIKGVYQNIPKLKNTDEKIHYDFESNQDYYDSREENDYVGIIDKPPNVKRLLKTNTIINDVFKLRPKRNKFNTKKREIGLPSIKGATCQTAKDKNQLAKIASSLGVILDKKVKYSRDELCNVIKSKLLFLEKYSGKYSKIPKKTYMIIPVDHKEYIFPYNLEDRIEYIEQLLNTKLNKTIKDNNNGTHYYTVKIKESSSLDHNILQKYGFILDKNEWIAELK